jgi:hypothetical protein
VVLTGENTSDHAVTASGRRVPLLLIRPFIDETTLAELSHPDPNPVPTEGMLYCCGRNDNVSAETIATFLERLALERLERKTRRFEERLKQLIDEEKHSVKEPRPWYLDNAEEIPPIAPGYSRKDFTNKRHWEQLLYEGIMESLGYSKNHVPFLSLAQSVRLDTLRSHDLSDTGTMMAILFGAAGLLPSPRGIADRDSRRYVGSLRRRWSELHGSMRIRVLNPGDWLFFRLRPANFPTARLAAFCFALPTLFREPTLKLITNWFKDFSLPPVEIIKKTRTLFAFQPDDFWEHHYHFRDVVDRASIHLGRSRVHDIILNVFVPIVMLYARVFNDFDLRLGTKRLVENLPSSEKNNIIRAVERELTKGKVKIESPMLQQGALQLFKYYCSGRKCADCAVGKVVFAGEGQP